MADATIMSFFFTSIISHRLLLCLPDKIGGEAFAYVFVADICAIGNAYTYYKIQRYKSAIVALRNALKTYPDTPYREKILYLITVSNRQVAHNSIEEKKGERYLKVLDSYYSFINEFPESKHRKELERYTKEAKDYLDKNNIEKQK